MTMISLSDLTEDKVFVIAEIGGNHEGSLEYAYRLIDLAAESGADAIKFQTYTADSIVNSRVNPERHKHFKKFEITTEEFRKLAKKVADTGKMFLTSVWDVDLLNEVDDLIPLYKVGSGDLTNYPMLERLAKGNKPIILSTAMSYLNEIRDAVKLIADVNPELIKRGDLGVLHCVAMYGEPKDEYANLNAIRVLQDTFPELIIGYSDHTVGIYALELAVGMGAKIIEKHFTDDITRDFRDHHISATKESMLEFIQKIPKIKKLCGDFSKKPIEEIETEARIQEFRRAVYLKRTVNQGEKIELKDVITLRPNKGIDAREYKDIIGKRAIRKIDSMSVLDKGDFE